jgi:hypothetical protein
MSSIVPISGSKPTQSMEVVKANSDQSPITSVAIYLFNGFKGIGEGIAHLGLRGITYAQAKTMSSKDSINVYRDALNQITGNEKMSLTCRELAGRVAISIAKQGDDAERTKEEIELKLLTMVFRLGTSIDGGSDVSLNMLIQLFGQLGAETGNLQPLELTTEHQGFSKENKEKLKDATRNFSKYLFEKAFTAAKQDPESAALIKWLNDQGYLAMLTDKIIPEFVTNIVETFNPDDKAAPAFKPLEILPLGHRLVHFFKSSVRKVLENLPSYRKEYEQQERQLKELVSSAQKRMEQRLSAVPMVSSLTDAGREISEEVVNALIPNLHEECIRFLDKDSLVVGGQRDLLNPVLIHFLASYLMQQPEIAENEAELHLWKSIRGNSLGMLINKINACEVLSKKEEFCEKLTHVNGNDHIVKLCENAADKVTNRLRQSLSESTPKEFQTYCESLGVVQDPSVAEGLSASLNWISKTQDGYVDVLWTLMNQHLKTAIMFGADRLIQAAPHLAATHEKNGAFIQKLTRQLTDRAVTYFDRKKTGEKDNQIHIQFDSSKVSAQLLKKMFPKGAEDLPVADEWKEVVWKGLHEKIAPFALGQIQDLLADPGQRNRILVQFLSAGTGEDFSNLSDDQIKEKLKDIIAEKFSQEIKITLQNKWEHVKGSVNKAISDLFGHYGTDLVDGISHITDKLMITAFINALLKPIASFAEYGINAYGRRSSSSWVELLSGEDHRELINILIGEALAIIESFS